jgi:PHD/YefM family antitoxin component YafN of YafNO toxin-antitoxin module
VKTIELATATKPLSEYAQEFDDEIIILTSRQEPVAVLVSLKNVDSEAFLLSMNPEFMQIIEKARAEFTAGKTLTLEEMKRDVVNN